MEITREILTVATPRSLEIVRAEGGATFETINSRLALSFDADSISEFQ